MPPVDPRFIDRLVGELRDARRAEDLAGFPASREAASRPGLYSWWADDAARKVIEDQLGLSAHLIYVGQTGATRWPSGQESDATLADRIRGDHINGNASGSTFRWTLSALLLGPLDLTVRKPRRLVDSDKKKVTQWMKDHLRVAIVPFDDRDSLDPMEDAVLQILDPPLNLKGRPKTEARRRLKVLRKRINQAA